MDSLADFSTIQLLSAATGLFVAAIVLYRTFLSPISDIPGPFVARFSIAWQLWILVKGRVGPEMARLHKKHGKFVRIGHNEVSICHSDAIKEVLRSNMDKSQWYSVMAIPNGNYPNQMSECNAKLHMHKQKNIAAGYSLTHLIKSEPHMDELLALFQKRLDEMDQAKQAVKFDRWFNYLAIDTVGEVTFSKPFGFLEAGVDHGQTVATQHYLQIYLAVIGHFPWLHNATLANPLLEKWGLAPATFISDNCGKATNARLTNDKVRRDMMELWLDQFRKHPEKMSETEVSTTAMVTVGAGSDTISAILQTITYHLLRDRDMFLQLRQEIDNANLSPIPQYEETHRLPVLSACIKEALRHHPPVSTNYPRVSPPGGVTVCGRFFPAGTVLSVSPYAIHSIPEVFGANIDKFDPGRWLNASQTEHRNMENHLVAFGAGYNQCPGQQLARLELYKTAALMVRDYDVEQVEKSKEWKCDYHFGAIPYDWDCYVRRRKINEE